MATGFTDELKVSLIVDATEVDRKIRTSKAKLAGFRAAEGQKSQVRIRVNIAELEIKLNRARKELRDFRKEGNKSAEIKAQLKIKGLQDQKTQANKALREVQKEADKTTKSFFSLNGIVKDALKSFGAIYVIREFARSIKSAFDAAVSFETAFAGVRKTVDATEAEFADLSTAFRKLSRDVPVAIEELLRIGELGGQLGVATDKLIIFTETIAKIAVTTNLTAEDAATQFARIANIFQEPIENVERLASSVVDLGNNFATTESEILNFATGLSGTAAAMGLTTQDVAALGAAFTSVGVAAQLGGTAVQKTLLAINDAVVGGGQILQDFGDLTGKTAEEFAAIWRSDPIHAFELFVKGLGESGDQAANVLEELVAGDVRLKRVFLSLAQSGDLLTRAIITSNEAFEANTALTDEANKRFETTASLLQLQKSRWNDMAVTTGQFLIKVALPIIIFLTDLAEGLSTGEGKFAKFAKTVKAAGVVLFAALSVKLLTSITTALVALGARLTIFTTQLAVNAAAAKALGGQRGALYFLRAGLVSILSPTNLAIAAVAGLTFAWLSARKSAQEFKQATDDLNGSLETTAAVAFKTQQAMEAFTKSLDDAINGFIELNRQQAISFGPVAEETAAQVDSILELQAATTELLKSFGATSEEVSELTDQLGFFNGSLRVTAEDEELIRKRTEKLGREFDRLKTDFNKLVKAFIDGGQSFEDAITQAIKESEKQWIKGGKDVEEFSEIVLENLVKTAAEGGETGAALNKAWLLGFDRETARSLAGVAELSDQAILIFLNGSIQAGDAGATAGFLWALGITDDANELEAIRSSENLLQDVIDTMDRNNGVVRASGERIGSSLVGGIIDGLRFKIPALSGFLGDILEAIGGFNISGILDKEVTKASTALNKLNAAAASVSGGGTGAGGAGGGGGGKSALDNAEKEAKEAAKAVEDFVKAIEKANKASEDLRNDIRDFYQDIVNSIEEARDKQIELNDEFRDFKNEETAEFVTEAAERDVELAKELLELTEDQVNAQKELDEAKLGDSEGIVDQDKVDEVEKDLVEIAEGLAAINAERVQIEDFLAGDFGAIDFGVDAEGNLKTALDLFNDIVELSKLSEFERGKIALAASIEAKDAEIQLEIDKQQKIIDIQKKFLDIQSRNDAEAVAIKQGILDLATADELLSAEERAAKLAELGFEDLTKEQEAELLKQFVTANALDEELRLVDEQQQDILDKKQEYLDLTEKAFSDSVDRQIEKQDELIARIDEAIDLQQRLNALSSGGAALQGSAVTTNVNVTNNNQSNVDVDAALNNLLNQI